MNGIPLNKTYSLKILGLRFDKKLNWNGHINTLKQECNQRINILKNLASKNWGADTSIILNTYKAIVRSKLDYGAIIYNSASSTQKKKLNTIQTTALRFGLGAFKSSPCLSLLAESNELPLESRRNLLVLNSLPISISSWPNSPAFTFPPTEETVLAQANLPCSSIEAITAKLLKEYDLQSIKIASREIHPLPPWSPAPEGLILDIYNSSMGKNDTPRATYQQLFNELVESHTNYTQIYTDGSILDEQRGCAVVWNDEIFKFHLPVTFSIFSCEVFHQGIPGNQQADEQARLATSDGVDLSQLIGTGTTDLRKKIKNISQSKWDKE